MKTQVQITLLCIVFASISCKSNKADHQPKSERKFGVSELPASLRDYSKVELDRLNQEYSVTATPSKTRYVEGEKVFVNVKISRKVNAPDAKIKWRYGDGDLFHAEPVGNISTIGVIQLARSIAPHLPAFEVTDSTWFSSMGGWAVLAPTYLGKEKRGFCNKYGFAPGKFRAFVDLGITSDWFQFEVVKPTEVEAARRSCLDFRMGPRKNIHELRDDLAAMDRLFLLEEATPLRCEALADGLERLVYFKYDRSEMPDLSSEDSLHILKVASEYCKTCPKHSYNDFNVPVLAANLMTSRGGFWRGNHALGAYLAEMADHTLLDNYLAWRRVYRQNEPLEPSLYGREETP